MSLVHTVEVMEGMEVIRPDNMSCLRSHDVTKRTDDTTVTGPGPRPRLPRRCHDNTTHKHHVTSDHMTGERMLIGAGVFSNCC